jgi:hypothetical protein
VTRLRDELEELTVDDLRVRAMMAGASTAELEEAENDAIEGKEVTYREVVVSPAGGDVQSALVEITLACYDEAVLEAEAQLLPGAVDEGAAADDRSSDTEGQPASDLMAQLDEAAPPPPPGTPIERPRLTSTTRLTNRDLATALVDNGDVFHKQSSAVSCD